MNVRAAHRYAEALMGLGEERKSLDKISEDLATIERTMHASKDLVAALHSPVIKPDAKLRILNEIFSKQLHQEVMLLIQLIVRKGRADLLLTTAEEFRRMLDVKRHITQADIVSAVDLSEDEKLTIQAKLENMTGMRIRPVFRKDPSLKGGFTARVDDTLIDASLSHQLELLREQFKQGGSAILN